MIIDFNRYNGGGGSGSGVTPQDVQLQIDSALTPYWDSAVTESAITEAVSGLATEQYVQDALSGVSLDGYWNSAETQDAISAATAGKADAKILVDFDHTSQAERATLYATLKTLYDGGSGSTINRNYDFYKTVNTWQGLKIDYYGFSGDTMVFGKVASPDNTTEQVVYAQVLTIDSGGNVEVVTNQVGGVDLSGYYTSAQTESAITSKGYITAEDIEPDVIYEAEGNDPGFYAINSSALTTWQIENLDLSPYQFVRFYIKASDIGFNSGDNFTAPMYVDVVLDPKSLSSQYQAYLGVTTNICAGNRNRSFHTVAAVDITKSKVQLLYQTSLWDVSVSSAANNGRYCYKIVGYRYNVCGTADNGGGGGTYTAGPNIDISPAGVISVSGLSTINGSAITAGGNIEIQGGGDMSGFWNSAQTKSYVDSAVTNVQDQVDTLDEVVSTALVDLNEKKVESQDIKHMVKLTQAEYDQLVLDDEVDPETFYIIINNSN